MTADVKVYSTVVAIDEPLDGLKPGMSAEVTIHIDNTIENVLTVPVQAIVGGAESGRTRKVYVMTSAGPEEREVQIGLSNEKMAEIREGIKEGEQVVVNPKAILGDKIKTREEPQERPKGGPGMGKGKGGPPGGGGASKGPPAKP